MFGARRQVATIVAVSAAITFVCAATPSARDSSAQSRGADVRVALETGDYELAVDAAKRYVASVEAMHRPDSLEAARAADFLVEALARNGEVNADTVARAEAIVRSKEAKLGSNSAELATSLRNLANVLAMSGEYKRAISSHERGLAIRERTAGSRDQELWHDLDDLAATLSTAELGDRAWIVASRAVELKASASDRLDARLARTLEIQTELLQRRGDYSGARAAVERALAIRQTAGPKHPDTATTLRLLGDQLVHEGKPLEARGYHGRALALAEATLRADHPALALHMRRVAHSAAALGYWEDARRSREHALALAERSWSADHPSVIEALNDLATSHLAHLGSYPTARRLLERARTAYRRRFGPTSFGLATVTYNLALANQSLGDYQAARSQFDQARVIWTRLLGPDHPVVARVLSALASMLAEHGSAAEAHRYVVRALAIRRKRLGADHPDVARAHMSLSTSLARLGQLKRAIEQSTRALEILERANEVHSVLAAEALVVHGAHLSARNELPAAKHAYERALVIRQRALGPQHPDVAGVQVALARVLEQAGDLSLARHSALEAESLRRDHVRATLRYLPERESLAYTLRRSSGLDIALSIVAGNAGERERSPRDVLDAVVRGRAVVLDEMAARQRVASGARVTPLWTQLNAARQRLANLVVRGPGPLRPEEYRVLVDDARREKDLAERALAEQSALFSEQLARNAIGLEEVRSVLPDDGALVSFVRYDREIRPLGAERRASGAYIAFVTRADRSEPVAVPLGNATAVDGAIAIWRREASRGLSHPGQSRAAAEQTARAAGRRLRALVWDPLHPYLHGRRRVFVVPDATLNLVSLAALPAGTGEYLLESGPVLHYLSAERDLVHTADVPRGRGLLALGGASFDGTRRPAGPTRRRDDNLPGTTSQTLAGLRGAATIQPSSSDCVPFDAVRFSALPGTLGEASDIAGLWGMSPATSEGMALLTGADAAEAAFKTQAPGRRVLHLATHGFFVSGECGPALTSARGVGGLAVKRRRKPSTPAQESTLLLSGLAFAGANRRALARRDQDDGILTAEEVAGINLAGVEWAVLSACDTGLGRVEAGEGVFGLRRAFQIAGARTVIMSLWSVEDRAARAWMHALYDARLNRQLDTANAVREASLSVLRDRRSRGLSTHPFYWAGFVAAGDWR